MLYQFQKLDTRWAYFFRIPTFFIKKYLREGIGSWFSSLATVIWLNTLWLNTELNVPGHWSVHEKYVHQIILKYWCDIFHRIQILKLQSYRESTKRGGDKSFSAHRCHHLQLKCTLSFFIHLEKNPITRKFRKKT